MGQSACLGGSVQSECQLATIPWCHQKSQARKVFFLVQRLPDQMEYKCEHRTAKKKKNHPWIMKLKEIASPKCLIRNKTKTKHLSLTPIKCCNISKSKTLFKNHFMKLSNEILDC